MKYVMRQRLLTLTDDYDITNEQGTNVYYVDGKLLALGKNLSFQDTEQQELAHIQQKLMNWGPTYEITHNGELVAVVKKELFTFFHCVFHVDEPGHDALTAEGNFSDHEYVFTRAGRQVAAVSKQWFTFADTYGVDVTADDEDPVLLLACTVVIDEACHGDSQRR
ncbi:MAG TPA: LURP-one-related family protein [Gemmatimonadaceae bacterium]|nr:LURP-one-related family protein [Gemmatimonadaceae bacterium]